VENRQGNEKTAKKPESKKNSRKPGDSIFGGETRVVLRMGEPAIRVVMLVTFLFAARPRNPRNSQVTFRTL